MTGLAIHLMPYDGIGGVEVAAASAEAACTTSPVVKRMFVLEGAGNRSPRTALADPRQYWRAGQRLKAANASLVVVSLWRSVLVGLLAKLMGCKTPMVLFLHNTRDAHFIDRLLTRIMARQAVAIWADSQATLRERMSVPSGKPTRVISYLVAKRPVVNSDTPVPVLAFWGRLAAQKNPLRLIALLKELHAYCPGARLELIGPDGGEREAIESLLCESSVAPSITLHGPKNASEIAKIASKAAYYVQTSHYEGMSLSTIEAMQMGLVPVVTPVGEIANYTRDGVNAVWIGKADEDLRDVARRIARLTLEPETWREMRTAAISCWGQQQTYAEDFASAVKEVLIATRIK